MVFPDPIGELVVTSKPVLFPNHRWYFMTVSSSTGRFVGYKTATVLSLYHNVTGHDAEYLGLTRAREGDHLTKHEARVIAIDRMWFSVFNKTNLCYEHPSGHLVYRGKKVGDMSDGDLVEMIFDHGLVDELFDELLVLHGS